MTQPLNPHDPPLDSPDRLKDVDMSPEAIERRLREIGKLYKAWQSLRHFKQAGTQQPAHAEIDRIGGTSVESIDQK